MFMTLFYPKFGIILRFKEFYGGCSSVGLERPPVKGKVASSSLVSHPEDHRDIITTPRIGLENTTAIYLVDE